MTPAGEKLDRFLAGVIAEQKGQRMPKAGAKFFALVDEIEASERRLDDHADVLLESMRATEELAQRAIQTRVDQQQVMRDYINRVQGVTGQLAGGNNGPPLGGDSSPPSPEKQSGDDAKGSSAQ